MKKRTFGAIRFRVVTVPAAVILLVAFAIAREARHVEYNRMLMAAVREHDVASVSRLLQRGADPNATDIDKPGKSLWQTIQGIWSRKRARKTPTALLVLTHSRAFGVPLQSSRHDKIAVVTPYGYGGPRDSRDLVIARLLLSNGALANAADSAGNTPLLFACGSLGEDTHETQDDVRMVELLLTYGARADCENIVGETPLMYAVEANLDGTTELLLTHGASPNLRGYQPQIYTPLIMASMNGNVRLARLLLDHRANVDGRDTNGLTALMWAAHTSPVIVRLLLQHAPDVNVKLWNGESAISFAKGNECVQLLKRHGAVGYPITGPRFAQLYSRGRTVHQFFWGDDPYADQADP